MALPSAVSRYLFQLDGSLRRAVCFLIDNDYTLQESWGDVTSVTDSKVETGQDARDFLPVLHGLPPGEATTLTMVSLSKDRIFDIHLFQEGTEKFVLLIPTNVKHTEREELQQVANEVQLLNTRQARLLKELGHTRVQLEKKRQEADRASMIKSRFIASMSHEFRTPLTSVIGYTELLISDSNDNSDTNAHASAIGRSARHLLSMVDNILDQSRIEEGNVAIRIAPMNIRQMTDDITAMLAPLAAEKFLAFGAYVDTTVPRAVKTDEVRLRQILVNLVGNAVKFTDSGEVKIEISWADDVLKLIVSDTGPGIPPEHQERIFDAFHRVAESQSKRGTGLGLNISTRLVEMLGGKIELQSEPGKGSSFTVTVKAPQTSQIVAADHLYGMALDQEDSRAAIQCVLIAEDDPDVIELLSLFLRRGGYQIILANDGAEAVKSALADDPDLVLMDVNMPNLDGLSAARELRNKGFDKPILALTASLSANDRDQAFSWGCTGYLVKPISMPELLSAVDRHLNDAR